MPRVLLVSQNHCLVGHHVRQSAFDQWLLISYDAPGAVVKFPTLGVKLPVSEIYARVTFSEGEIRCG